MSHVSNQNLRDWDAQLRAKQRAHALVQAERISAPDVRSSLHTAKRMRRTWAHLWAPMLGLSTSALSYVIVSNLIAAPSSRPAAPQLTAASAQQLSAAVAVPAATGPRPAQATPPPSAASGASPTLEWAPLAAAPSLLSARRSGLRAQHARRRVLQRARAQTQPTAPGAEASDESEPEWQESYADHEANAAQTPQPSAARSTRATPVESSAAAATRGGQQAQIDALRVSGSLATSSVKRALERLRPEFTQCYDAARGNRGPVRVEATIDEMGRVRDPRTEGAAGPTFASCITTATRKLVSDAPDTGTVSVAWRLHLTE